MSNPVGPTALPASGEPPSLPAPEDEPDEPELAPELKPELDPALDPDPAVPLALPEPDPAVPLALPEPDPAVPLALPELCPEPDPAVLLAPPEPDADPLSSDSFGIAARSVPQPPQAQANNAAASGRRNATRL